MVSYDVAFGMIVILTRQYGKRRMIHMKGAAEHNNPAILAIRRTIETRISVLNALFNIEHPLARSLAGLQLEIERAILVYNLGFFIN